MCRAVEDGDLIIYPTDDAGRSGGDGYVYRNPCEVSLKGLLYVASLFVCVCDRLCRRSAVK